MMGDYEIQRIVKMKCSCGYKWRAGLEDKRTNSVECPKCAQINNVPLKNKKNNARLLDMKCDSCGQEWTHIALNKEDMVAPCVRCGCPTVLPPSPSRLRLSIARNKDIVMSIIGLAYLAFATFAFWYLTYIGFFGDK